VTQGARSSTAAEAKAGLRRAAVLAALLLALVPAQASAAQRRSMCADQAALYDAPGRIAIGHLYRPQRLIVMARTNDGRWTYVRTAWDVEGWSRSRVLCHPR
jgi:hypothetical protein